MLIGDIMGEIAKLSAEELAELRKQIRNTNPEKPAVNFESDDMQQAEEKAEEKTYKRVTVAVAEDKMSATVRIDDPGEEKYTVPEIVDSLRKNKVITGIHVDKILEMVNNNIYEEDIVVAEGKPCVPAEEGYYEFFFDTEEHKTPTIREDGTADYASVGRFESVKEGQLIAVYHPAKQGKNGYNVLGMEIVVKFAKELPGLRGQHIRKDEEKQEYYAECAGKISLKEYNIEILDVHEINEDVTMLQGKVEFYGDIVINGDVENGVVIRAGRNVVINGTVGAASIFAGGDIILQKGIQGAGRGKASARGNVFSDFVEYAKVDAGQDVYANSVINSNIATSGSVVISGKHGSIIGGETHGLRGITANAAGNMNEVKTMIHAGFLESDYYEFAVLAKNEKVKNEELEQVVDEITAILKSRNKSGINSNDKAALLTLKNKKDEICKQIEDIKESKADISRKMAAGQGASIVIRGDIYRNVCIAIDVAKLTIANKESYVKYICKNNTIERRTIPIGF